MKQPYYEHMNERDKKKIDATISQQAFLDNEADVDYMCYYLRISPSEFWERFLWKYLREKKGVSMEDGEDENLPVSDS